MNKNFLINKNILIFLIRHKLVNFNKKWTIFKNQLTNFFIKINKSKSWSGNIVWLVNLIYIFKKWEFLNNWKSKGIVILHKWKQMFKRYWNWYWRIENRKRNTEKRKRNTDNRKGNTDNRKRNTEKSKRNTEKSKGNSEKNTDKMGKRSMNC